MGALMFIVVETTLFSKLWPAYWSEEDQGAFAAYIAQHSDARNVIRGTGGLCKVLSLRYSKSTH